MAGLACFRNVQRLVSRASSLAPVVANTRAPAALSLCRRAVGTSGSQKSETASVVKSTSSEENQPKKNWVTFGFSEEDEWLDNHLLHVCFFLSVSLVLVGGAYILIYFPDFRMRDWAHREAHIELRRRERLGLPLIDPNLIDPAKVQLPTDEELGDTEIII